MLSLISTSPKKSSLSFDDGLYVNHWLSIFGKDGQLSICSSCKKNEQMEDTTSEPPSRAHCGRQPCNNSLAHRTHDFHLSWERRPREGSHHSKYYRILQAASHQTGAASPRFLRKGHSFWWAVSWGSPHLQYCPPSAATPCFTLCTATTATA